MFEILEHLGMSKQCGSNGKLCRPRSDCSFSLIWVYTVCPDLSVQKLVSSEYNFISSSVLEKNLRLLMESVDEVSMDANKFVNFLRQYHKQQQAKQDYQRKRVRFLLTSLWYHIKKISQDITTSSTEALRVHHCQLHLNYTPINIFPGSGGSIIPWNQKLLKIWMCHETCI